jgi:hypothetical protein
VKWWDFVEMVVMMMNNPIPQQHGISLSTEYVSTTQGFGKLQYTHFAKRFVPGNGYQGLFAWR